MANVSRNVKVCQSRGVGATTSVHAGTAGPYPADWLPESDGTNPASSTPSHAVGFMFGPVPPEVGLPAPPPVHGAGIEQMVDGQHAVLLDHRAILHHQIGRAHV